MDDLDQAIIQELSEDGRKPFMSIAKRLNASTQTIIRRYDGMKANGTIALLAIRLNLAKLGYTGTAHLRIDTKPEISSIETVKQLRKTPNIIIVTRTLENYEVYAVLAFKEAEDLYENVAKIKKMPNVTNVQLSLAMPGIKHFPPKGNQFNLS
jgi:DNA-binding Lrp family transcriptional regulator